MGQLVGAGDPDADIEPDSGRLFPLGLMKLINVARPNVFYGLMTGYGNVSSLFVALWNSDKVKGEELDLEDAETENTKQSAYNILNEDIAEKGLAFTWLDQGAYQLLDIAI